MLSQLLEEFKKRGYRITAQRKIILEAILSGTEKQFTAYEVLKNLKRSQQKIGLDTIYRNINILLGMGFLTSIGALGKDGMRYEFVGSQMHHHHVVCMNCGEAQSIDYCPVDEKLLKLVEEQGYDLVRHQLELIGVCRKCRK